MRQTFTPYPPKLLLLTCTFFASTLLFANTDSNNTDKDQLKEENQQEMSSNSDEPGEIKTAGNQESENQEDEVITTSDVSFNFVFYLIYKIKYAEIFKLPGRKREGSSSSLNAPRLINGVLDRLVAPRL